MILAPILLCCLLQCCLLWNSVTSFSIPRHIYPRPALFDAQLSASLQVSVEFSGATQEVHTSLTFQPPTECIGGEPYNYTVLIWLEGVQHVWHYEGPFEVSTCEGTLSVPVSGLKAEEHYTAAVVVFNRESSFKSKSIDIYTTAVQRVEVIQGDECVLVNCYFAQGSSAQGCVVVMKIVNSHTSQHLHIWRYNITQDTNTQSGGVHVHLEPITTAIDIQVYDWQESGRPGSLSISPLIKHVPDMSCHLGETSMMFRATAKMVLFYVSAGFFLAGFLIILVGLLCKVGKLHHHFYNKSYEILEGRDSMSPHTNRSDSLRPVHVPPASKRPRAKSYGSYEIVESPAVQTQDHQARGEEPVILCTTDRMTLQLTNGGGRADTPDNLYHSMAIVGKEHVKES